MPIYNFKCDNCDEKFMTLLKIDELPDVCPNCFQEDPKKFTKQVSAPTIRTQGMSSMSVRHTTSEYFGPYGKLSHEEYNPEEVKRKEKELKDKLGRKGASIVV